MDHNAKYWKCEYENLRRKKNRQIEIMKLQQAQMITTLFKTLEDLGIDGKDFIKLYECNRQN